MKNKIFENIPLKIASLVVAFIIWLSVTNVVKPIVVGFVNVPVSVINEDAVRKMNKTYIIQDQHICKVSYKISQDQSNAVRQTDFRVFVDLSDIFNTEYLPVQVETLNGIDKFISNVEVEPKTLHVVLNDAVWNEFPIKYNINGQLDEDHSVGNVVLSPNILYVSGKSEDINNIANVLIDIPIDNRGENFSGKANIHLYDKDEKEIRTDKYEISATEVNYSVAIFTKVAVNLNAIVEGKVKEGYSYLGVEVSPNIIGVDGPRSVVENLYNIDLPIINIDDLSEDTEFVFMAKDILPAGVNCFTTETVSVKVKIDNNNVINSPRESLGPDKVEETKESVAEEETKEP